MTKTKHLLDLLSRYRAKDKREGDYKQRMEELLGGSDTPFSRDHFDPGHFTASAFVLSPDRSSLLMIFHSKLHRWLQPGGHIEPSDPDVIQAAMREILEETGVTGGTVIGDGLFDLDIHTIPARKGDPDHSHFDLRILLVSNSLEIAADTDAVDAKWVPLSEVSEVESDESVMRAVGKILNTRAYASNDL
jgi:8-oxo-dGTP pyrophosphatase MutT (NUDIX family)